ASPSRAGWKASTASVDELIVTTPTQDDLAGRHERADDLYDGGLGLLLRGQALRAEQVDLLEQVLAGPLGDVAEHLVAHGVGDTLEGHGEDRVVDLTQDEL